MKKYLPILDWLPNYERAYLSGDIAAGFTVGVMLIPQGMAYAMIAGLPPVHGLYAALVPNLVYAVTGSSRKLAVGPVALDSLIVASGLAAMKLSGLQEHIAMALFLALFVGLLQVLMGFLKMGFLANFLSRPVVSGFTSAAALVIAVSQLKYLLGIELDAVRTLATLQELFGKIDTLNVWDLAIGVTAIVAIFLLKKLNRKLPAAMVVVVLSILGVYFFSNQNTVVTLLGFIPQGLPSFQLHTIASDDWVRAFPLALVLAFIAFAEAMTMAKAVEDKSQEYHTDPNQELRALGVSNIMGSFFQSYPANSGFSRTAVNVNEGAKTGLASIISAAVVGLTLLFLTPYFQYLPKTVLGAIILVAVYGLVDIKYPIQLAKQQRDEFMLYAITFLTTLFIGVSEGIIFGVLFSLVLLVYRSSKPHVAVLGKIRGMEYFKNVNRFAEDVEIHDEILMIRFDAQLFFANVQYFKKALLQEVDKKGAALKYVILNAEPVNYIDNTAMNQLENVVEQLRDKGIAFKLAGAIGPIRDTLQKNGLVKKIGQENIYVRTAEAYADCLAKVEKTAIQEKVSLQHK
ncbi:solute carrier family 26 protein [Allomuricauda sp. d1]|uniref:SulP family inorganic anion transporter n=1 Tax=Allomuricauda sp. d1 TaxID=3136725 RepID=UPI0031D09ECE